MISIFVFFFFHVLFFFWAFVFSTKNVKDLSEAHCGHAMQTMRTIYVKNIEVKLQLKHFWCAKKANEWVILSPTIDSLMVWSSLSKTFNFDPAYELPTWLILKMVYSSLSNHCFFYILALKLLKALCHLNDQFCINWIWIT